MLQGQKEENAGSSSNKRPSSSFSQDNPTKKEKIGEQLYVKKQILEKLKDQIHFSDKGDKLDCPFYSIGVEIKENEITVNYCETSKNFQLIDIDLVVQQIFDYLQQDLKKLGEFYGEESSEEKLTKEELEALKRYF